MKADGCYYMREGRGDAMAVDIDQRIGINSTSAMDRAEVGDAAGVERGRRRVEMWRAGLYEGETTTLGWTSQFWAVDARTAGRRLRRRRQGTPFTSNDVARNRRRSEEVVSR